MTRIWLASGSPRRRELLTWAGWEVDVHPPEIDESLPQEVDPLDAARGLAQAKADTAPPDRVVVAADTLVHISGQIFGKPVDHTEAKAHLTSLSGRWHEVTTGVCVRRGSDRRVFSVTTRVRFRDLTAPEIDRYVSTGEPADKAGAYGIQGQGGVLISELRGSWTNVMGLPVEPTIAALRELAYP